MDYYKRYMGDYQRDTGHLSLTAHGAFGMLLDHYYSRRKPLPADLEALHRICRATTKPEQQAVNGVAEEFFPVEDDGLRHNGRADEEIVKWEAMAEENREKGKLGGRPKKNPTVNPEGNPNGNPTGYQNGTHQQTKRETHRGRFTKPGENPLQLLSQKPNPDPEPEPTPESELETRTRATPPRGKPASAADLLASPGNGEMTGHESEAGTLRNVVKTMLGTGSTAAEIIRAMPARGLTEEQIVAIAREPGQ